MPKWICLTDKEASCLVRVTENVVDYPDKFTMVLPLKTDRDAALRAISKIAAARERKARVI